MKKTICICIFVSVCLLFGACSPQIDTSGEAELSSNTSEELNLSENELTTAEISEEADTIEKLEGIQISTAEEFAAIANNLAETYVIVNDIDLSGLNGGALHISGIFTGTLNGNGYSVKGLVFDETIEEFAMFEEIGSTGTIKNLGVEGSTKGREVRNYSGGICITNNGTIDNCYFIGEIYGLIYSYGGICCFNNGTISNSYFDGNIYCEQYRQWTLTAGGIAAENTGNIINCYVKGSVAAYGEAVAGGIVAIHRSGLIENCVNYSDVTAIFVIGTAGGIAAESGEGEASPGPRISKCLSIGNVTGIEDAGGISGWAGGWTEISNCVVLSKSIVSEWEDPPYGPRVAHIAGTSHGFWEEGMPFVKLNNNLILENPANHFYQRDADRIITQAEAIQADTYISLGWDFETIWRMGENGYPELRTINN